MPERNDDRNYTTRGYDNNKIAIWIVMVLVAVGVIWYGVDNFIIHRAPAVHSAAPVSEPVGQGPGTPARP